MKALLVICTILIYSIGIGQENSEEYFLEEELNGWLRIGIKEKEVLSKLGKPISKSTEFQEEATGLYIQTWLYPSEGIKLDLGAENEREEKEVERIFITTPCTYKTRKGISIGSEILEVQKQYENQIDSSFSNDSQITLGTIYGGVFFYLTDDKVNMIVIGALYD